MTRDTVAAIKGAFDELRSALAVPPGGPDFEAEADLVEKAGIAVCNLRLDLDLIAIAQDPRVAVQEGQPLVTAVLNALDAAQGALPGEIAALKATIASQTKQLDTERAKVVRLERELMEVKNSPPAPNRDDFDPEPYTCRARAQGAQAAEQGDRPPDEDEEAGAAYTLPPGQFQRGYSDRYVMQSNGALVFYLQGKPSAVLDSAGRYHRLP